ncbi:MAG: ABC transporter ATP-binding protein [Pseudomonadota bacterium]
MPISHLLEDFRTTNPADTATLLMSSLELEEQRLAAFEKGYSAGWEDALAADMQSKARLSTALLQNIENASFSYHEAMAQMQTALTPVFEAMAEQLLPGLIRTGLAPHIVAAMQGIAQTALERPLVLSVPPGAEATIAPLLPETAGARVVVMEDQTLQDGQARLALETGGIEIDLRSLASEIQDALAAYVFELQTESSHDRSA